MKIPNRQKFTKNHKRNLITKETRKTGLVLGNYGIKATETGYLKMKQMERIKGDLVKKLKDNMDIYFNFYPVFGLTNKGTARMGAGKGEVSEWYVLVKKGSIVVEFIKSRMTAGAMAKVIRYRSNFSVMDNSGARKVQCIQTLEGKKPTSLLRVGDKIVVVIKKMEKRKGGKYKLKVKKSDVCYAVIVKSKQPVRRPSGVIVNAGENGVILLTKTKEPIGTRLTGVVFKEVQRTGLLKNSRLLDKYVLNKCMSLNRSDISTIALDHVTIKMNYRKKKKEVYQMIELITLFEQITGEKPLIKINESTEKSNIVKLEDFKLAVRLHKHKAQYFLNALCYVGLGERKYLTLKEENNIDLAQLKLTYRYKNLKIFRPILIRKDMNLEARLAIDIQYKTIGINNGILTKYKFYLWKKNEFRITE
ncbi:hypothetical protein ACTFIZ_007520 [Dictyostelium cf. discoideum]